MDELLVDLIESNSNSLAVEDELEIRDNLRKLEAECKLKFEDKDEKELKQKLWLHLARLSVKLENVELSLVVVAKLKLSQLALLLRSTLQTPDDSIKKKRMALSYMSSYFHLDSELATLISSDESVQFKARSIFDCSQMVDFHINRGDWDKALGLVEVRFQNKRQKTLNKQLIFYKLAQYHEIDENFPSSLANYEKSGTQGRNSARTIIKQYLDIAYQELRRYCMANASLQSFWKEYSLACGYEASDKAQETYSPSFIKCGFTRYGSSNAAERVLLDLVPEKIQEFLRDVSPDKWASKKKLESLISIGSSLNFNARSRLSELAMHFHQTNHTSYACCLYLCLGQLEAFLNLVPRCLDRPSAFRLACQFGSPYDLAAKLMEFVSHQSNRRPTKRDELVQSKENQALFTACLNLGLIDEAVQVFSTDAIKDERVISQAVEYLENAIAERHTGSLDNLDPNLTSSTMLTIQEVFVNNQILATHVITVVILSITISLLKLDPTNIQLMDAYIAKLEVTFKQLSDYLDELSFNASDALVRATNSLVTAVKGKLEVISDSDTIRESFRHLVETAAGRCMIEGRYRSAAMLHSQIEDNVSAVKSLMRIGDVDVVINFSLLVRDITVNRITINYLKHLGVDQPKIDDFTAKTRQL